MLEINNKHKKMSSLNVKRPKRRIISSLLGVGIAITSYSGALSFKAYADNYADNYDTFSSYSSEYNDEVSIPLSYRADVAFYCNKGENDNITINDLQNLTFLSIWNNPSEDMSFLKYCTGIEGIIIKSSEADVSNLKYLDNLNSLKQFSFVSTKVPVELNTSNCTFLMNNKNINEIRLKGHINVEPLLLEKVDNLSKMTVCYDEYTCISYDDLDSLKELKIDGKPYDVAVSTSVSDIERLKNNGVKIDIDYGLLNDLKNIESKISSIIDELDISENDSDFEKMNKIALYALENLTYDEKMDEKNINGDDDSYEYSTRFYQDGILYGALELDTQICGNYAAFVSAIAHRLGVYSYHLLSNSHSWNLVKLNGDYYYVDTTWMDNQYGNALYAEDGKEVLKNVKNEELLRDGNERFALYYLDQPLSYEDASHKEINFPSYIIDDISNSINSNVYIKDRTPIQESNRIVNDNINEENLDEQAIVTDNAISTSSYEKGNTEFSIDFEDEDVEDISGKSVAVSHNGKTFVVPVAALLGVLMALGGAKLVKKHKISKDMTTEEKIENKFRI